MTCEDRPITPAPLCRGLLIWLLLIATASAYTVPRFPQSALLSSDDVAEALALAREGEVVPYLLDQAIGGGPKPKVAIYTPFVRVALAARAGVLTFDGSRMMSSVAQPWIASPEVLVVIGSPCPGEPSCVSGGDNVDTIAGGPTQLYIRHQEKLSSSGPAVRVTPIRLVPLKDLRWLGTIPVDEPAVAATFSPQEFRTGSSVRAEWGRWDRTVFVAGGYVQGTDLETRR